MHARRVRSPGELLRQGPDAVRGHPGHAEREHANQQAREGLGGLAPVLGEHPGEERLDHLGAQRTAHPGAVEPFAQWPVGGRGPGDDPAGCDHGRPGPPGQRGDGARGEQTTAQRGGETTGRPQRVGEFDEATLTSHLQTGSEGAQVEGVDVDPALHSRIGGVEHLKAAVEEEAVDLVGALAPTHGIRTLQHDHGPTGLREHVRTPQPGQPGTHDHDIRIHGRNPRLSPPDPVSLDNTLSKVMDPSGPVV